jgi:hypothetical protein
VVYDTYLNKERLLLAESVQEDDTILGQGDEEVVVDCADALADLKPESQVVVGQLFALAFALFVRVGAFSSRCHGLQTAI